MALRYEGFEVQTAASGYGALEQIDELMNVLRQRKESYRARQPGIVRCGASGRCLHGRPAQVERPGLVTQSTQRR